MTKPKRFIPFSFKLLISYLLLVMVPLITMGTYYYYSSIHALEAQTRNNLQIAMQQISNNIDFRMQDIVRGSEQLYSDQLLAKYLSNNIVDWERFYVTTQYVVPKIESAMNMPNTEVSVKLYLYNHWLSELYFSDVTDSEIKGRQYALLYADRIMSEDWYRNLHLEYNSIVWKQVGGDKNSGNISLLRPLIDLESLKEVGLLRFTVRLSDVLSAAASDKLGAAAELMVLDERQQPLLISSSTEGTGQITAGLNRSDALRIDMPLQNLNATLTGLFPNSTLRENADRVRNVTIGVCLLLALILSAISYVISKFLSKRIDKLGSSLNAFQEGQFNKRIHYKGNDEFTLVANAFNDMASTIDKLIEEVYLSNLQKKEIELNMLQSQVNPHFLYNTFSSISRMAQFGDVEKLHEMIRNLARFYRLTLSKGETYTTVDREVQQIQAYMAIQKIRYADRIKDEYDIDPEIMQYRTVKFIFQPFVENVLEHAWYDDMISIKITGRREGDTFIFEIIDNGLGMKEETIQQIWSTSGANIGYGIRNVDERIKLLSGKEYGVTIRSWSGEGTTIRLRLPMFDDQPVPYRQSEKERKLFEG